MIAGAGPTTGPAAAGAPGAASAAPPRPTADAFDASDLQRFRAGTHTDLQHRLGCHAVAGGARFAVWAPHAEAVSVIGDVNGWDPGAHPLQRQGEGPGPGSGIWQGSVPGVAHGQRYKFALRTRGGGRLDKADPFARWAECPPASASVAWLDDPPAWHDEAWMAARGRRQAPDAPISIYELHLGSWRRGEGGAPLDYRSAARLLAEHVLRLGFTHVGLLPLMEHAFHGSWGYQPCGHFAPTARHGTPADLRFLVDTLHQAGIGVVLDWVPSRFSAAAHGLAAFDGGPLYEPADPQRRTDADGQSIAFDLGRPEVRSFLLSSAMHWLDAFHVDALRVDGVASIADAGPTRREGGADPHPRGGPGDEAAAGFLRRLSDAVAARHPGVCLIAGEPTGRPGVTRPAADGGLGFGLQWNRGWTHDTLACLARDPVHRRWHHEELTGTLRLAFNERFVLPLPHDEVAPGRGSLWSRLFGDDWQRFAHLRLLFGWMWTHPGKKLLFMGGEFAQRGAWNPDDVLDWWLREQPAHAGVERWVEDLNRLYRGSAALHQLDADPAGFEWVDAHDAERSVLSFLRRDHARHPLLVVANFTPVPRTDHLVGVPVAGRWRERLNSDATLYGGSGVGNAGGVDSVPVAAHGHYHALVLQLPPLGVLVLEPEGRRP